jgi:hypothetical protein
MKKHILVIALFSCCAGFVNAQEGVSESRWKARDIVIDGNDNDWVQPLNFFDNTSGMIFGMANDTKNIYLCFSNNDRNKAAKMMMAGWSVQLVSSEKKRKFDATIVFPKMEDPNLMNGEMHKAVAIYKAEMKLPTAKGLVSRATEIPLNSNDGISIGIGADEADRLVYEIKIPVKELLEEQLLQLNELISVDIVVNALDRPSGQSARPAASGEATTGRGGFGGGRMARGGGSRGGGNFSGSARGGGDGRAAFFEKASFKQKIKLVNSQASNHAP